jgi:hypothetical protein
MCRCPHPHARCLPNDPQSYHRWDSGRFQHQIEDPHAKSLIMRLNGILLTIISRAIGIVENSLAVLLIVHIISDVLGTILEAICALRNQKLFTRCLNLSMAFVVHIVALVGVPVWKRGLSLPMALLGFWMAITLIGLQVRHNQRDQTPMEGPFSPSPSDSLSLMFSK